MSSITNRGIFKLKEVSQLQISDNWADITRPFANSFGYFIGGNAVTRVDRLDYSNDNTLMSPRGPLSLIRYAAAAVSNSDYAYIGSGLTPTLVSTVERIDYANDTAISLVRGLVTQARQYLSATGNSDFGYFGGGIVPPTAVATVDRIDYSNDLVTAFPRG